ncbi:MAG: DNA-binding domain-containing protein [Steroidobacteraceae bacterium]
MSLPSIQSRLQAFVLDGAREIEQHIVGTAPLDVATRLAIYGNAYRARLTEALATNYPAIAKLLGAGDFGALATAYIASHVSRRPSIRFYGDELSRFLAVDARYGDAPLLAELAAWEWSMTEVFDAADASAIDIEMLTRVPPPEWGELRFTLHPAIRRLDLRWNVPQLWKALTSASERPQPELAAEPQAWLLWREGLQIVFRSVDPAEAAALSTVCDGRSFGEMCVQLCGHVHDEAPTRAASYLRGWVEAGLVVGLRHS